MTAERRQAIEKLERLTTSRSHRSAFSFLGISQLISTFAGIVVFFYLLDCLFSRTQGSQHPVLEIAADLRRQVVLSKLAVALVVVPIWSVLLVAQSRSSSLLSICLAALRTARSARELLMPDWDVVVWLQVQRRIPGLVPAVVVWYLPLAGYLLLVSVWARKQRVPVGDAAAGRPSCCSKACSSQSAPCRASSSGVASSDVVRGHGSSTSAFSMANQ